MENGDNRRRESRSGAKIIGAILMDKESLLKNDLIYKKIDDFIEQLHEKNIVLNPKAQTLMITENKGKDSWGKTIKESQSLANRIGEEMAYYQKINNSETMADAIVNDWENGNNKNNLEAMENFVRYLDVRSALRSRKIEVANNLFRYIELAYCNNLVEEIGLGNKLKAFEEENAQLKEKNAGLQKLNSQLVRENSDLQKYFPDNKKGKGMVGELASP